MGEQIERVSLETYASELASDISDFVFLVANGTFSCGTFPVDYREFLAQSRTAYPTVFNAWITGLDVEELRCGKLSSCAIGNENAVSCLTALLDGREPVNPPIGGHLQQCLLDFSTRLTESTLGSRNEEFSELIYNPAELELIYKSYCAVALVDDRGHITNHEACCDKIGELLNPDSDVDYGDLLAWS